MGSVLSTAGFFVSVFVHGTSGSHLYPKSKTREEIDREEFLKSRNISLTANPQITLF